MPKDIEVSEGGSLMDPASPEFAAMLESARTKGEEALSIKPDTSMSDETPKDVKETPESSSEGKGTKEEDDDTDDVETLKNRVRGMKAEMSRIRGQRSASDSEAGALKERLAKLEGRLEERESQHSGNSAKDNIKKLSEDKLIELHTAYEDELADARAVARNAERDGDRENIVAANQRIDNARKMLNLLKGEENVRMRESVSQAKEAGDENTRLGSEIETLFAEVFQAAPELADTNSELWKAGQAEYKKLPVLTKKLGPLGELIATATAIAKNPQLLKAKNSTQISKVLDTIEAVADKSFNKGGAAPTQGVARKSYQINSQKDALDFEAEVNRVKLG